MMFDRLTREKNEIHHKSTGYVDNWDSSLDIIGINWITSNKIGITLYKIGIRLNKIRITLY